MFAEEACLGFDPSVRLYRVLDDGSHQYDITVRSDDGSEETYRTLELLSDNGSRTLRGRGTRVWKAVRLVRGSETSDLVALKDCWVDHHREREGAINARMREAAASKGIAAAFEDAVVRIAAYGDVYISGSQDRTLVIPTGEMPLQSVCCNTDDTIQTVAAKLLSIPTFRRDHKRFWYTPERCMAT